MIKAGDVVLVDFIGATGVKRRPAVVVSSDEYHAARPDVLLAVITSHVAAATTPLDHPLRDWSSAGLHVPSAFRPYSGMALPSAVRKIGTLSKSDWQEVADRCQRSIAP